MISQSLKDNQIHLSIDSMDFSYRIPVKKIGNSIDWKIGEKGTEGIVMKHVSAWTLKLFTANVTDEKFVKQFEKIVKAHAPDNTIDWEETFDAVNVQNEYNSMKKENAKSDHKLTEDEIISALSTKYKLDLT
ncbi:hypothetical protein ERX46_16780 [Brumimicrobium glaciale]|uniref:Uncharacterized protein n=1 Tax=Brumimicrobium glaciale TaxID=200475 RepID=A0A4Q4KFN6_9FLAO|nr:hypothetical protein [Brumimicrobium glaciale]RYM31337.1 hypothetical protein ERX46_16780 [Brumimicrobium glaciale]